MDITRSKDNCRNRNFFRPLRRTKSLSQIQRPQTCSDRSGGFTHRLPMQLRSYGSSDKPGASCDQKLLAQNLVFWPLAERGKGESTGRNRIPIGPVYLPIDSSYIEYCNEAQTDLEHHVCRSYWLRTCFFSEKVQILALCRQLSRDCVTHTHSTIYANARLCMGKRWDLLSAQSVQDCGLWTSETKFFSLFLEKIGGFWGPQAAILIRFGSYLVSELPHT